MNKKGQFFSPDIIIAIIVFVFALLFFFLGSGMVFTNVTQIEKNNALSEVSVKSIDFLISQPGKPTNWEDFSLTDLNVIGLAHIPNNLSNEKVEHFFQYLDSNYSTIKNLLTLNRYDFKFQLIDYNGSVIFDSNYSSNNSRVIYDRIVLYNDKQSILREIIYEGDI